MCEADSGFWVRNSFPSEGTVFPLRALAALLLRQEIQEAPGIGRWVSMAVRGSPAPALGLATDRQTSFLSQPCKMSAFWRGFYGGKGRTFAQLEDHSICKIMCF